MLAVDEAIVATWVGGKDGFMILMFPPSEHANRPAGLRARPVTLLPFPAGHSEVEDSFCKVLISNRCRLPCVSPAYSAWGQKSLFAANDRAYGMFGATWFRCFLRRKRPALISKAARCRSSDVVYNMWLPGLGWVMSRTDFLWTRWVATGTFPTLVSSTTMSGENNPQTATFSSMQVMHSTERAHLKQLKVLISWSLFYLRKRTNLESLQI